MLKNIDFSPGKVTYDEFHIDPQLSFEDQEFSFNEDLFQVSYGKKYTLDVGWYSGLGSRGMFRVVIIKNYDWMNPVYSKRTNGVKRLYKIVEESAEIVRELTQNKK